MSTSINRKISTPQALAELLTAERAAGRTIVQCHGCFDIVHPGHVRYLQFARRLGDRLIVSLTSDEAVAKGAGRPYIPQELRAENLAALEFVDWVVIDPNPTAAEILAGLKPDVYVKGREYATAGDPRFAREREIVESYGGRVVFHSGDVVFSSTRLIETLGRDEALDEHRLRAFCERGGIDATTARDAIGAFDGLPAIVVGDLVRERYVLCDASEAAGDAPVLALRRLGSSEYWGGAAATALQLRALGAAPLLVSAVSTAEEAQTLTARFRDLGVEALLLPARPAIVERCTFVSDESKIFKVTDGAAAPLDSRHERAVGAMLLPRMAACRLLVWSDQGYGFVTPGLVGSLAPALRRAGLTIAGHAPGRFAELTLLNDADLLVATERQLRTALHDMGSGLPAAAWTLLQRTRSHAAIISMRRRGMIGFDRRHVCDDQPGPQRLRSEFVPCFASSAADWTGGEEAILATAALTLATGHSLALGTYLAAAGEALAVRRTGHSPVQAAELSAWLEQRPELRPASRFFSDAATVADLARLAPPLAMGNAR